MADVTPAAREAVEVVLPIATYVASPFQSAGLLPCVSQHRIAAGVVAYLEDFACMANVPFLEDILNSSPFIGFHFWLCERGNDPWSACPPSYVVNRDKAGAHVAAGRQPGVGSSKLALDPLVNVTADSAEHLRQCLSIGHDISLPWHMGNSLDDDLQFSIEMTLRPDDLRAERERCSSALRALKQRCTGLDETLRRAQGSSVSTVASNMSLGLMAVLAFCCRWPDMDIIRDFILGFTIVGDVAPSGVLRENEKPAEGTLNELGARASDRAWSSPRLAGAIPGSVWGVRRGYSPPFGAHKKCSLMTPTIR